MFQQREIYLLKIEGDSVDDWFPPSSLISKSQSWDVLDQKRGMHANCKRSSKKTSTKSRNLFVASLAPLHQLFCPSAASPFCISSDLLHPFGIHVVGFPFPVVNWERSISLLQILLMTVSSLISKSPKLSVWAERGMHTNCKRSRKKTSRRKSRNLFVALPAPLHQLLLPLCWSLFVSAQLNHLLDLLHPF